MLSKFCVFLQFARGIFDFLRGHGRRKQLTRRPGRTEPKPSSRNGATGPGRGIADPLTRRRPIASRASCCDIGLFSLALNKFRLLVRVEPSKEVKSFARMDLA